MKKRIIVKKCSGKINGSVTIQPSKNAATKLLGAAIFSSTHATVQNHPDIADFNILLEFLSDNGYGVSKNGKDVYISMPKQTDGLDIPAETAAKSRSFLLLLPALLYRHKKVIFYKPTGCNLGSRPVDISLDILRSFGATVTEGQDVYAAQIVTFQPTTYRLDFPGVALTSIALLCAAAADGTSEIIGCSLEPEVLALVDALNGLGAKVEVNNDRFFVIGKTQQDRCIVAVPPDRNAFFTYCIATLISHGKTTFLNYPMSAISSDASMSAFLYYQKVNLIPEGAGVTLDATRFKPHPAKVYADWYPAFQSDWQPLVAILLLQAHGVSSITDAVFENRLSYWNEFAKAGIVYTFMNATKNGKAIFNGPQKAKTCTVSALDIRAGAAAVLLGLLSDEQVCVENIYQIERGYEDIVHDLRGMGLDVSYG